MRQRKRAGSGDEGGGGSREGRKQRITLESFDLYTKVREEEAVQTNSGGTGAACSGGCCRPRHGIEARGRGLRAAR